MSSADEDLYWDGLLKEAIKIVKGQKQQSNLGRICRFIKTVHERQDIQFKSPYLQDLPTPETIASKLERAVKKYTLHKTIVKGEATYNIPHTNYDRHLDLSNEQCNNKSVSKYLLKVVREMTKTANGEVANETVISPARIGDYIRYSSDISWSPGIVRNDSNEWIHLNSLIDMNLKHLEDKLYSLFNAKIDYTEPAENDNMWWLDDQSGNLSFNTPTSSTLNPAHGGNIFGSASPNTINRKLCKIFCPGVMNSSSSDTGSEEHSNQPAIIKEEIVMENEIAEDEVGDHFSRWNNNETDTDETTNNCNASTREITKPAATASETEAERLKAKARLPQTVLDGYVNKNKSSGSGSGSGGETCESTDNDNDHEPSISQPKPPQTATTSVEDTVTGQEQEPDEPAPLAKIATNNNNEPTVDSESCNQNLELASSSTSSSASVDIQNNEVTVTSNCVENIEEMKEAAISKINSAEAEIEPEPELDEQPPPIKKRKGRGRPPGSGKKQKKIGKALLKKKEYVSESESSGQVNHENINMVREKRSCVKTDELKIPAGNIVVVPLQSTSFANSHSSSVSTIFREPEKENECIKFKKRFNLGSLMLKEGIYSDAQLILDNYEEDIFRVHKGVLGCQSLYFSKMFKDGKSVIKIDDVSPGVLKPILNFLYRGRFNPNDDMSLDAHIEYFKFSVKYSILRLVEYCKKKILNSNLDNLKAEKGICLIEVATIESLRCDDCFLDAVLELIKPIYSQIKIQPKWKEMITDPKYSKMIQKLLFIVY